MRAICHCCPRGCGVDRTMEAGYCGAAPVPQVARAALHFWEEPALSGTNGSGTIFFSGCNMRCVFCQNREISASIMGEPCDAGRLAALFFALEEQGAHNINLVTPTPHLPAIREAIFAAKRDGLAIPVVYNTGGYESPDALRSLEGLVDIYLPDLKYVSARLSERYSNCSDYFRYAAPAVLEMQRQVGKLVADGAGIARRGLIIRHLALPGSPDDTRRVLDFIAAELPKSTQISLMRQYTPPAAPATQLQPPLHRRLTSREYDRAVEHCLRLGLHNVWIQGAQSAQNGFTPSFFHALTVL